MIKRAFNHVTFYGKILINKISTISIIGNNASYFGSSKNNSSGLFRFERIFDTGLIAQVKFFGRADKDSGEAIFVTSANTGRSLHSAKACHNSLSLVLHSPYASS